MVFSRLTKNRLKQFIHSFQSITKNYMTAPVTAPIKILTSKCLIMSGVLRSATDINLCERCSRDWTPFLIKELF